MNLSGEKFEMIRDLIVTLIVCLTDFLKIYYVLRYILGYEFFFSIKNNIFYIGGMVLFFTITYMLGISSIYQSLFFVPIILLMLVKSLKKFELRFFLFFLVTYICICQIDVFITAILKLIFVNITAEWIYDLLCAALSIILIGVICYLCERFSIVINREERSNVFLLIQLGMLVLIVFLIGTVSTLIKRNQDVFLNRLLLFSVSGLAVLITIGGLIVYTLIISNKHHKEMEMLNKKIMDVQSQYYKEIEMKNEDIRRFKHDIKNHIICLKYLLREKEYDEATNYVLQLETQIRHFKPRFTSGNHVIDAILNEKINYIEENEIKFSFAGKLSNQLKIQDYDLCILFANAFENAIEACIEVCENRFIDVKIGIYNNFMSIIITNSTAMQKDLKTTKIDKSNHGFGMKNISRVVEKYNGSMQITQTKSSFRIDIIIKVD